MLDFYKNHKGFINIRLIPIEKKDISRLNNKNFLLSFADKNKFETYQNSFDGKEESMLYTTFRDHVLFVFEEPFDLYSYSRSLTFNKNVNKTLVTAIRQNYKSNFGLDDIYLHNSFFYFYARPQIIGDIDLLFASSKEDIFQEIRNYKHTLIQEIITQHQQNLSDLTIKETKYGFLENES